MIRTLPKAAVILAGAGLLALGALPALAHHSFAMFDFTKSVTLKGTVREFAWTNPHVVLWVNAETRPGAAAEVWSLELTSPGNLTRGGWTKRSFNPGDKVEVVLNPLRNGQHGGAFVRGTLTDTGKVYTSNLRAQNGRPGLD